MASVALPRAQAPARLAPWGGRVEVAAVNGPASVVVAGEPGPLDELVRRCQAGRGRARRVTVDYASHSSQVEEIREELAAVLGQLRPGAAADTDVLHRDRPWIDGRGAGRRVLVPRTCAGRSGSPTRSRHWPAQGYTRPHRGQPAPGLATAVEETLDHHDGDAVVAGTLRRGEDSPRRLAVALAEVFVRGVGVDWAAWFAGSGARVADLPTYPFQRDRYWLAAAGGGGDVSSAGLVAAGHPLLGAVVDLAGGAGAAVLRAAVGGRPAMAGRSPGRGHGGRPRVRAGGHAQPHRSPAAVSRD